MVSLVMVLGETGNQISNDLNAPYAGVIPENAIAMRDTLAKYFSSQEGQVPWQSDNVHFAENLRNLI